MDFGSAVSWLVGDISHISFVVLLFVLLAVLIFLKRVVIRGRREVEQVLAQARMEADHSRKSTELAIAQAINATEQAKLSASVQRDMFEKNIQHIQRFEVLGALTGSVAHDFNNIITAILGYTSLIMGDLNVTTTLYRNLSEIHKAGERATALVAQLMSFSRKRPVVEKVIDLKRVLRELERMLHRLINEKIEIKISTDVDLWNMLGDQAQIEQIMVNLVVNAGDAMPKGGKILITANNLTLKQNSIPGLDAGEYIRLQVSDNGTGIPPQDLEHIFEPFFTTKDIGKGTGLGLATVSGLMKRLGGVIQVESKLGQGTTFTIYIPREASAATILQVASTKLSRGHETILIVEDETQVRTMLEMTLNSLGYDVVSASSGDQAIESVDDKEINLVISDVVMPGMTVHKLIENLRKKHPYVCVLLISGHLDEAIADLLIPNVQIISKPFSMEMMSSKIREILDSRDYIH